MILQSINPWKSREGTLIQCPSCTLYQITEISEVVHFQRDNFSRSGRWREEYKLRLLGRGGSMAPSVPQELNSIPTSSVVLKSVEVTTIKPVRKVPHPAQLDASLFDLYLIDMFMPVLLLYKNGRGKAQESYAFVDRLKNSLSEVLVSYYPYAGRWARTDDARIRALQCTDEGVPFIEAYLDEDMDSLIDVDDFQPLAILSGFEYVQLDPYSFHQDVQAPIPAFFVQATRFKCGGLAVNFTYCHQLADGKGIFEFLQAWSQIAAEGQTSIEPVHDRSLTVPVSVIPLETIKMALMPSPGSSETQGKESNDISVPMDWGVAWKWELIPQWTRRTLHVRKESVQRLKLEAQESNIQVSSMDCVHAFLWRGISNLPESIDGKASTMLGIVVEGRKRMHCPPLPDSYSGNAFVITHTPSIAGPSKSPLTEACMVHRTVASITPTSWIASLARSSTAVRTPASSTERQFFVTSWFRFSMYEADFGFGKPDLVAYNNVNSTSSIGYAVVCPPRPGSDYIASIQVVMSPASLEALMGDQEFRSYFH